MPNSIEVSFRDFDGTRGSTEISVLLSSNAVERQALKDALALWSSGSSDGFYFNEEIEPPVGISATNSSANDKLQAVIVIDDTIANKRYFLRLPMPDLNKAPNASPPFHEAWENVGNNEATRAMLNINHDDWPTLRDALEAIWISPDGNAGTILEVYIEQYIGDEVWEFWNVTHTNYQLP